MAGLAVLLLSDRARQRLHVFVVRHFRKAQHDSVRIWTLFSQRLASVTDQAGLCTVSAKLISETFDVLSVTIWLAGRGQRDSSSSAPRRRDKQSRCQRHPRRHRVSAPLPRTADAVVTVRSGKRATSAWAEELRQLNPSDVREGRQPACVFPFVPGNGASASSCSPIASMARSTRSRSSNC